ncbi:hypothetical protein [Paraburkholderia susongensis]|uniref:Lipoprotein n=1 Tax=Paraburkholderia susongensis TaxID=1515439 RepID=A0A1X7LXR7_9BURK|nr:hypothetical protein [Paraburkholderia susongensis]SMG58294.1 hypothetical protein SAMN06265784_11110 [Paraburkholderia susongensis]
MRVSLWLFAALVFGPTSSIARAEPPLRLEDCPVAVEPAHAIPHLTFTDAKARHYSSVIRDATKEPVNFAGRYVLATWGCGAGCVMAAAIDTKTGRVISLPFTVSDWPADVTEPLSYLADSCLLIVRGSRNESAQHGTYYYAFDGKTFRLRTRASESRH